MVKYIDIVSEVLWGSVRVLCGHPYKSQIKEYNPDEDEALLRAREEHRITMDRIEEKVSILLEETSMLVARMNTINEHVAVIQRSLEDGEVE